MTTTGCGLDWWRDKAVARGSSAETLLGHLCLRRRDALSPDTGPLWQAVAPQPKCSEDLVYTHHQFLLLMLSRTCLMYSVSLWMCVCVCVCLIDNYTIMTLLSPNLEYVDIWLLTWQISCKQVRNLSYFWWEILHNTIQWTYILTLWWSDWWFLWTVKLLCKIEPCCQLLFIICPRLCSSIGNLLILEKVT